MFSWNNSCKMKAACSHSPVPFFVPHADFHTSCWLQMGMKHINQLSVGATIKCFQEQYVFLRLALCHHLNLCTVKQPQNHQAKISNNSPKIRPTLKNLPVVHASLVYNQPQPGGW